MSISKKTVNGSWATVNITGNIDLNNIVLSHLLYKLKTSYIYHNYKLITTDQRFRICENVPSYSVSKVLHSRHLKSEHNYANWKVSLIALINTC